MYFSMLRNLQRFGWLIPYLFGSSPAVCKSFVGDHSTDMEDFDAYTYYYPYATSLRMGDIGYQNNKEYEAGFKACYDNLNVYIASLTRAIETPYPKYEEIGVVVNGEYRQLNANILQIENEYYSTVRPKQVPIDNEKPTLALRERGVRYIELRSLDINAYAPLGIDEQQLRFLETFLIFCLFLESPRIGTNESREIDHNGTLAAHHGRDPALCLHRNGRTITLRQWAAEILDSMQGFSEILDTGETNQAYSNALESQRQAVTDPDRTPAAKMLAEMRENRESFHEFARRLSEEHYDYFKTIRLSQEKLAYFTTEARNSWERQARLEESDTIPFDVYLNRYFAQN
jgi:glutamate--cysteine ligase